MEKIIKVERLQATKHMFEWLAEKPFEEIISNIENMLSEQVSGTKVTNFEASSDPEWLTGAIPCEDDETKVVLVRTGVAFEFQLTVDANGNIEELSGVYSWVRKKVEEEFKVRTWFDINGTLAEFGDKGALAERIY